MPFTTLVLLIAPPVLLLALTIWYYVTVDHITNDGPRDRPGDGTEP